MRKVLIFGVTAGLFAVVLLVLLVLRRESPPLSGPWDAQRECPLELAVGGRLENADQHGLAPWDIFVSGDDASVPRVTVDLTKRHRPPGFAGPSCELEITKLPGPIFDRVDWRMGHRFKNLARFRGKTVRVSMMLKADREILFDAAAAYSYDGKNIPYHAIGKLDQNWRRIAWDHPVPANATAFEVWLRLTIHGVISTTGSVYLSEVQVSVP